MRKLKRSELGEFRRKLYEKQEGLCPLCLGELPSDYSKTAIDHDHTTGEVRGLLHLGCNRAEGSVFKAITTWGKQGKDYKLCLPYLERLVQYLKTSGEGVIYHLHKTPDEEAERARVKRNAQAKARRLIKGGK